MKKTKFLIAFLVIFSITIAITPPAIPQVGTYTFHGAPGNVKILKVRTVDNSSLEDLFGVNWDAVLEEFFGVGCVNVGAMKKSLVTAVNTTAKDYYFGFDATNYTTNNWKWTTGEFPATPDDLVNFTITSLYNPLYISFITDIAWGQNATVNNAGFYFAQLPTSVAQYLGAVIWEPKWENIANQVFHYAVNGDFLINYAPPYGVYMFLENCTEIWTYDTTYGSWIGYKILDDESNTIFEFSIELSIPGIPGYELPIIFGVATVGIIGVIFVIIKKKRI